MLVWSRADQVTTKQTCLHCLMIDTAPPRHPAGSTACSSQDLTHTTTHVGTPPAPLVLPAGLCNAEALEQTLSTIDNNNLARLAGVNRAGVQAT